MLVLSRKKDEVLLIGNDIKVTIVDVDQGKVKVGIDAPRSLHVHREEVRARIQGNCQHEYQQHIDGTWECHFCGMQKL